jgi:hypothetical protein
LRQEPAREASEGLKHSLCETCGRSPANLGSSIRESDELPARLPGADPPEERARSHETPVLHNRGEDELSLRAGGRGPLSMATATPIVIVGYDGSEPARRALEHAAELVGRRGSVSVINVIKAQSVSSRLVTLTDNEHAVQDRLLRESVQVLAAWGWWRSRSPPQAIRQRRSWRLRNQSEQASSSSAGGSDQHHAWSALL